MLHNNQKEDVIMRLKTIKGHVEGILKMVEDDVDCEKVMLQISAIKKSIEKVGFLLIDSHASTCFEKENISKEEINKIINTLIKFLT
ncbi:metal-sensitive transcriptional regulator [Caldicellulosiruptoraceae bacterium PP1]